MDDILMDHSDMYVLDFQPSLKTLCIIAVRKYKLDESVLPNNVKWVEIIDKKKNDNIQVKLIFN